MSDCCPRADGYHGPDCAEWWEQAYSSEHRKRVASESQVAALTASLAELRKRMATEHSALIWARTIPLDHIAIILDESRHGLYAEELRELDKRLASPPSPAPVESKPKEESK